MPLPHHRCRRRADQGRAAFTGKRHAAAEPDFGFLTAGEARAASTPIRPRGTEHPGGTLRLPDAGGADERCFAVRGQRNVATERAFAGNAPPGQRTQRLPGRAPVHKHPRLASRAEARLRRADEHGFTVARHGHASAERALAAHRAQQFGGLGPGGARERVDPNRASV